MVRSGKWVNVVLNEGEEVVVLVDLVEWNWSGDGEREIWVMKVMWCEEVNCRKRVWRVELWVEGVERGGRGGEFMKDGCRENSSSWFSVLGGRGDG